MLYKICDDLILLHHPCCCFQGDWQWEVDKQGQDYIRGQFRNTNSAVQFASAVILGPVGFFEASAVQSLTEEEAPPVLVVHQMPDPENQGGLEQKDEEVNVINVHLSQS